MKKSPNYRANKKAANLMADSELRGFNANIKAWSEAFKSSEVVKSVFAEDGLTLEMFNFEYIKENLKGRFDSKGRFCTLKKFETEEELTAFVEGADYETMKADKFVCFVPRNRFTAGGFYAIIKAANTAKVRADLKRAKEAADAKKAKEAAARKAEKIEKMRAELAALEAGTSAKEEETTKKTTAKKQSKKAA